MTATTVGFAPRHRLAVTVGLLLAMVGTPIGRVLAEEGRHGGERQGERYEERQGERQGDRARWERERFARERWEREHRYGAPPMIVTPPPAAIYAPPPVVMAPPSGLSIILPINIR